MLYIRTSLLMLVLLSFSSPLVLAQSDGELSPVKVARALSQAFEQAADKITPSLVSISSLKRMPPAGPGTMDPRLNPFRDFLGDEMFKRYFGIPPQSQQPRNNKGRGNPLIQNGLGSGFVISRDGYILTNNHVIEGADAVRVRLHDDREVDAEIVGTDPQSDVAVLRVEESGLTPVEFGNSDKLGIGEWVVAAGNPFGLERSITAGIVSARGRAVSRGDMYEDFIQTDAAINVGNSGGPLLNLDGRVIGVNTMILSRSGGNQGIGLAIPINMARHVADQLIDTGRVTRGWLGIAIQDLTEDLKQSFGFSGRGVLVGDVNSGGPADKGGILPGDIVLSINGTETETANELRNLVATIAPGSAAKVRVQRSGTQRVLTVTLGTRPDDPGAINGTESTKPQEDTREQLGLHLQTLSEEQKSQLQIESDGRVFVADVQPHSVGYQAGLRRGDIILRVGDTAVTSVDDFVKALESADLKKGLRLIVENKGMKRFAILKEG